ncbi:uncharacterized protein PV06_04010 [Exophiala oligosperma]|uniref:Dihydrodipicolinate synthase n=1 Tax=Exophiala oligosperma TaxID=215243 RepID=A0A0D2C770_9EURO|nr:uncharacterized protein PV06_04010 [Exophiala oligosperma]KIW45637.1 hypothetical protein PV06_04010 [Exophiala oligosperma]
MLLPPFYDALNVSQLGDFLERLRERSGLPLMYYHNPAASGTILTPGQISTLTERGVQYVKYTADDAVGLSEMLWDHGATITTFVGNDTLMFYGLAAGAQGIVWGLANVIPELAMEFWNVVAVQRDFECAREMWTKIRPLCELFESSNYAAAVKTGMQLIGTSAGPMRTPFSLLEGNDRAELERLLLDAGVKKAYASGDTKGTRELDRGVSRSRPC